MPDSFVYQPHVHTEEGVLTPDIVIDHLLLDVPAESRSRNLGLNLIMTARYLEDPTASGCASAALILVSGGRGAIATVGSAHWNPPAKEGALLTEQLTPKLLARESIRLDRLVANKSAMTLTTHRRTLVGEAEIGKTGLDALPNLGALIEQWSGAGSPRRTALVISARHSDSEPKAAIGYRVSLSGIAGLHDLEVSYAIRRISE